MTTSTRVCDGRPEADAVDELEATAAAHCVSASHQPPSQRRKCCRRHRRRCCRCCLALSTAVGTESLEACSDISAECYRRSAKNNTVGLVNISIKHINIKTYKWNPPSFFRFRQRNRDRGWFRQIRESGFSFTCEAGGFTETETGTGFGFDK